MERPAEPMRTWEASKAASGKTEIPQGVLEVGARGQEGAEQSGHRAHHLLLPLMSCLDVLAGARGCSRGVGCDNASCAASSHPQPPRRLGQGSAFLLRA